MAGQCIEKLSHSCGSGDGLQVFHDRDGYTGYCFACDTYVPDPYHDGSKSPPAKRAAKTTEMIAAEMAEIGECQSLALPDRKLTKATLEYFGIKVGVSEQDGHTPVFHFYPYKKDGILKAYKARLIAGKRMWSVGTMKEVDLFGWDEAIATGAKRLYITEGELDAASLYQALKDKNRGTQWEKHNPAVVSLANGAGSAEKSIMSALAQIRAHFKEVVLVFDQDEAGREATERVLQVLPWALTVALPAKDPNECLIQGRSMALCNAVLFKSEAAKTTRLVSGATLYQAGREQASMGLSWPWEGFTKLTRGLRFGETIYLGAGVKMGKSELVNSLAAHLMVEHGLNVFLAKPEEANRKTFQMVVGKVVGRHFHDPEVPFDYEAYDRGAALVQDRLFMLSLYQHLGWESLRADIMTAVKVYGCRAIFIDPITNLVNGINAGETNTVLQEIAQELAAMAKDLNILIFIFCHLKAPGAGDSHERGGKVFSHQFSGSRSMMRSCNLMIGLEGNKDPDLEPEQRNLRKLVILEDREFGASGYIRLYWNSETGLFSELKEGK